MKIFGIVLIVIGSVLFFAWMMANIAGSEYLSWVVPDFTFSNIIAPLSLFGVLGFLLPLIILGLAKHLLKAKIPRAIPATLWSLWGLSLVGFFTTVAFTGKEFKEQVTTVNSNSTQLTSDTIHLQSKDYGGLASFSFGTNGLDLNFEDSKNLLMPKFHFAKADSTSRNLTVEEKRYAHGFTPERVSQTLAKLPTYDISANTLTLPRNLPISEDNKWRNQKLSYKIYLPVGTYIRIDQSFDRHQFDWQLAQKMGKSDQRTSDNLWLMTENGLEKQL